MTTQTEALKMADALNELLESFEKDGRFCKSSSIRNELYDRLKQTLEESKEALAQQSNEQVEPTCWITPDGEGFRMRMTPPVNDVPLGWTPLFNHPPVPKDEQVEPVAYRYMDITEPDLGFWFDEEPSDLSYLKCEPLYTHPPVPTAQPKEPEQEPVAHPFEDKAVISALSWAAGLIEQAYRECGGHNGADSWLMNYADKQGERIRQADHREWEKVNGRWQVKATPPQRKLWVSLSDEQIDDCRYFCPTPLPQSTASDYVDWHKKTHVRAFARNVESKLRELNEAPQRKPLTDEQLDKAGMKLAECMDYPWEHMPEEGKQNMRDHAKAIIEAAHSIKE